MVFFAWSSPLKYAPVKQPVLMKSPWFPSQASPAKSATTRKCPLTAPLWIPDFNLSFNVSGSRKLTCHPAIKRQKAFDDFLYRARCNIVNIEILKLVFHQYHCAVALVLNGQRFSLILSYKKKIASTLAETLSL